jgi:hypothetical protein
MRIVNRRWSRWSWDVMKKMKAWTRRMKIIRLT